MGIIEGTRDFDFVVPDTAGSTTPGRRARRADPVGIVRKEDDQKFMIGDVVRLSSKKEDSEEEEFGVVLTIEHGPVNLEARLAPLARYNDAEAWRDDHTIPGATKNKWSKEHELIQVYAQEIRPVTDFINPVDVVSVSAYDALALKDKKTPNLFFTRYAYEPHSQTLSMEFDWEDVTRDIGDFLGIIEELVTGKRDAHGSSKAASSKSTPTPSPAKTTKVKTPRTSTKIKTETPKRAKKKVTYTENDDDDDVVSPENNAPDSDVDADFKSPVEEKPKKTRAKKTTKTGKKRGLEDDDIDLPQPDDAAPMTTPKKKRRKETNGDMLVTPRKMFYKQALSDATLPYKTADLSPSKLSPHQAARAKLHVAAVPDALPCRETEFSNVYVGIEGAIRSGSGTCIFVSGTPGSGKTATVREVVSQLQLRVEDNELPDFVFVELNGMKLTNPHTAYELLWEQLSGQRLAYNNAIKLLEQRFQQTGNETPLVVVLDELDQLVTLNQSVMYNFFNWPTLPHSHLIVVAIANTMDLPERTLSNKISSRLGLTRIQFPGYTHGQLRTIIESRLGEIAGHAGTVVRADAIEFASRKIASVSGDARRALDLCRRAVEIAELDSEDVQIKHIQQAANEATSTPMYNYLQGLPLGFKIFLCALLARKRRNGLASDALGDIIEEVERMIRISENADFLTNVLLDGGQKVRMTGFMNAVSEFVETGIIIQQSIKGERSAQVRLMIGVEEITSALKNDEDVKGMM